MTMNFEDCLKRKRIFKSDFSKKRVDFEIEDAEADLKTAKKVLKLSEFKWATVQAYYSLFHSARALLYSRGYGEKGHYCLYLALKEFFVKENILENKYAEAFLNGMILRENADYKRNYSEEGAKSVVKNADKFMIKVKSILEQHK